MDPGLDPGQNLRLGRARARDRRKFWAWARARAHPFDLKCLSIYFNFLNRKSPHTKPPCVNPPFNNSRSGGRYLNPRFLTTVMPKTKPISFGS